MNWPVFFKRTLSAAVFAAIMLTGLLFPDPYAIIILALIIQFLCLKEFLFLMEKIFPGTQFDKTLFWLTQISGLIVLLTLTLLSTEVMTLLLIIPIAIFMPLTLGKKSRMKEAIIILIGLLYVCLPMTSLVLLRWTHLSLPLALILMIWSNDTFAYIVGSFIGKTPFSSISPKKTWEGTIGGTLLTVIGTLVWSYFSNLETLPMYIWIGLALIAVVMGTMGDLLESKLKRMADVKDSGNIMPGHGGALDRFDSLLAALPFALLFLSIGLYPAYPF